MAQQSTTRKAEPKREAASAAAPHPSILTTHHKRMHPAWTGRTTLLPGWYEAYERANLSYWRGLMWAWRLFRASRNFDAVVTGAEHCGVFFAMLQTLLLRPRQRRPHVMIDFPWAASPGRLMMALKRFEMRLAAPSLDAIFAHASPEEAERFTQALRVREGLFQFVPFHHSLEEPRPQVLEGSYIFSGGNTARDYRLLVEALRGAPYEAVICTQDADALRGVTVPANVRVRAVSHEDFFRLMAASAVVVVPVFKDDLHPAGHTLTVNAMALGKPVILAGPVEYRAYLEDGHTGVLVPGGDVQQLRAAIDRLMRDRELARRLGSAAKETSSRFSPEQFFAAVFTRVDAAVAQRNREPGA